MVDKKLTRIPNFSSAEKEYLMMIALKYASILEDKKTNRSALEEKSKAWKKIETEFNNTAPILAFRSQEQLKRLYENRKKDLRKKLADHKKETYLTGGGPAPKDIVLDKVDSLLSQILNEKSVKGFHSEFDSDNMYQENNTLPMSVSVNENFEPSLKKKKTVGQASNNLELDPEEAIEIFEFVPLERTESENIVSYDNLSISEYRSDRCPPTVLQKPIHPKLIPNSEAPTSATLNTSAGQPRKNTTPRSDRRRPVAGLRALTSSDVGEKYNILLDRRLVLLEKQLEQTVESKNFAQEKCKQKLKILKLQEENISLEKEEKLLKIELLKTEINYKRSLLATSAI